MPEHSPSITKNQGDLRGILQIPRKSNLLDKKVVLSYATR